MGNDRANGGRTVNGEKGAQAKTFKKEGQGYQRKRLYRWVRKRPEKETITRPE